MALEEEVMDASDLAALDAMCEAAAAAVGHDDGDGDAGDDDTALPAPALPPNKEPETKLLDIKHCSDEAEATAAVDDEASFDLRRLKSEDDEAKEDGDAAASEPGSKPAGKPEFGDDEEEKPEEIPVLPKSRVPLAEGVLELPIDVNPGVAQKLIERMESAGLTPTKHSTPFKVAAPSLAGSTGDEIYFILADEVSRVREVKSAPFVILKPEQIVTVEGAEWLTQGALFFHCTSAQAASHMREQYGTPPKVLSQWLIVVFHAHAGSKPTFVPASAV